MKKIIRITTVPASLSKLLFGQLKFMSEHYDIIGVSSNDKHNSLKKIALQESIPTIGIDMTRKITPFKDLVSAYKLYKLFKKEKPFIVHSHTPKAGTLSMIAAKFAGVPHRLHTIAGLPLLVATGKKRWLLNTVEKITYAFATMIYPNSHGLYHIILEESFTTTKKLKVIANGSSNGIDVEQFNPNIFDINKKKNLKASLNINETDFVFLFVGRLVADKGIKELLEAFNSISKTYKNVKLLLVGDFETELDPLDERTLEIKDTNPQIISTGWATDVRPYFAIADVLAFPSYREGFPNVVMQAGAMELPAIVTNINGCNEIIIEGENGCIIPVRDAEALYDAMLNVYNETYKYDKAKCRELIVKRYQRQVIWDGLLQEYKNLENK
ncbi:glycosyltransferase family 4 protein [Algibacter amylolyticus]|uniref:Glycosyltransferase family 4 protein n=1 Tax=Algibacter amylolyticus TaxID=1608400 RepID=A0A5M7BDU7_9FLAO|nr:glycosyltransferase family 4 protein [Algibacter amylolyticus]KAA5825601.1 glycosyltransferase family 4 protein [Algibacter amylolyticus]MBB5268173.1 glycosyltransferase involved in cell wall biosynthesis [Algibacter amylolyticus]TSJ79899.1 glycosyltransferase family 4 protein [Algibacter amylolyticus]